MITPAEILEALLKETGLPKKPAYRPGEVQTILVMTPATFHRRCESWEPEGTPQRDPRGLESYTIGTHRRVTRRALLNWLAANHPDCCLKETTP